MTAVERAGVEGGGRGGGDNAVTTDGGGGAGGCGGCGGSTSTTTDGDGQPPKKPPAELAPLPRPGTPAAPANGGGAQHAEALGCGGGGGKLFSDTDAGDPDDQEDDEILEESPCKRWSKRREKVKQRDVPGIDAAYLAMDNETGNEVVWNEVQFSERKNFREQEEKIRAVFDNLVRLEHPNLVKFHKYWMDTKSDKPRIIFITEYMSSGSMSRFLQRARSSGSLLNIKAWKNWTRQILSALSYLHSSDPPIVHANLTCNSVSIQQNGLVKIGCVAPKTIHHHVKTFRENIKNVHYLAPEYDHQTETTIQADIYSFGVCALEMATTGALQSGCFNGASTSAAASSTAPTATLPSVSSTQSLPPPHATTAAAVFGGGTMAEKDKGVGGALCNGGGAVASIASAASSCALPAAAAVSNGPTPPAAISNGPAGSAAVVGCSHVVTQEMVHKALNSLDQPEQKFIERCLELDPARRANVTELLERLGPPEPDPDDTDTIALCIAFVDALGSGGAGGGGTDSSTPMLHGHGHADAVVGAGGGAGGGGSNDYLHHHHHQLSLPLPPTPQHRETRQVVQLHAELLEPDPDGVATKLRVQLQLDDLMNRQLTATLRETDTGDSLVAELVQNGFVSEANSRKVCELLTTVLGGRILQQQQLRVARRGSSPSSAAVAEVDQQHQHHQHYPPHQAQQQLPAAGKTS